MSHAVNQSLSSRRRWGLRESIPRTFVTKLAIATVTVVWLSTAVALATPRVTSVVVSGDKATLTVRFDEDLLEASANSNSIRLVRSGEDGQFGTGDDARIQDLRISLAGPKALRIGLLDPEHLDQPHRLTLRASSKAKAERLATILALEVSGELLPPSELVARIASDIEAIHRGFPEITALGHVAEWEPGELWVSLTEEAASRFLAGEFEEINRLNERFGPVDVYFWESISWTRTMTLTFSKPYHPEVLAAFYRQIDGVLWAGPPGIWCAAGGSCGGDSIYARPPRYTFIHCSSWFIGSCVSRHAWTFRVDGESAVLEGESDSLPGPLHPVVLVGANGGLIDGEFTGGFPSGDGVPGGDFVYRFRWDSTGVEFLRGDCNDDGTVDISDPLANLSFQFVGTFDPPCRDALDFDDSGEIDVTDPIANLTHQFLGGLPPAPPGKENCGVDPTENNLTCESFAACEGKG